MLKNTTANLHRFQGLSEFQTTVKKSFNNILALAYFKFSYQNYIINMDNEGEKSICKKNIQFHSRLLGQKTVQISSYSYRKKNVARTLELLIFFSCNGSISVGGRILIEATIPIEGLQASRIASCPPLHVSLVLLTEGPLFCQLLNRI